MQGQAARFSILILLALAIGSTAQQLAGLGESCAVKKCTNSLQCHHKRTGKRCVKVARLDKKCGDDNTICITGTRCELDEGTGLRVCMREVEYGMDCGPSALDFPGAVCPAGGKSACEYPMSLRSRYARDNRICYNIIPLGGKCNTGFARCAGGNVCVRSGKNMICQNLPEASIGDKCDSDICNSSTFNLICRFPRYNTNKILVQRRCLKLGREGEMCDDVWRHCDKDLACSYNNATNNRICQRAPVVGLGGLCGSTRDVSSEFASCQNGFRCVRSDWHVTDCKKENQPGASCKGRYQHCVKGYTCNRNNICVKEVGAGFREPCGNPRIDAPLDIKCKPGLRCLYSFKDNRPICTSYSGPGEVCDEYKRCFVNHECLRRGSSGPRRCIPTVSLGESCEKKICKCTQVCYGTCMTRYPCIKTAGKLTCSDKYVMKAPPYIYRGCTPTKHLFDNS